MFGEEGEECLLVTVGGMGRWLIPYFNVVLVVHEGFDSVFSLVTGLMFLR
jgi:hypothetical protein